GNRNCNRRNNRGTEILKKNKHHQENQNKRFNQRSNYLTDRGFQEIIGIKINAVSNSFGQCFFSFGKKCFNFPNNLLSIRTRSLKNTHTYRTSPVVLSDSSIGKGIQPDFSHIFQPKIISVSECTNNNIFKFFYFIIFSLVSNHILKRTSAVLA